MMGIVASRPPTPKLGLEQRNCSCCFEVSYAKGWNMLRSSSGVVPKAISCASFLKVIASALILNRLLVATGGLEPPTPAL